MDHTTLSFPYQMRMHSLLRAPYSVYSVPGSFVVVPESRAHLIRKTASRVIHLSREFSYENISTFESLSAVACFELRTYRPVYELRIRAIPVRHNTS